MSWFEQNSDALLVWMEENVARFSREPNGWIDVEGLARGACDWFGVYTGLGVYPPIADLAREVARASGFGLIPFGTGGR